MGSSWDNLGIHFSIARSLRHPFVPALAQIVARILCCTPLPLRMTPLHTTHWAARHRTAATAAPARATAPAARPAVRSVFFHFAGRPFPFLCFPHFHKIRHDINCPMRAAKLLLHAYFHDINPQVKEVLPPTQVQYRFVFFCRATLRCCCRTTLRCCCRPCVGARADIVCPVMLRSLRRCLLAASLLRVARHGFLINICRWLNGKPLVGSSRQSTSAPQAHVSERS